MAKSSRAGLIKKCRDNGIDFPDKATVAELEHILSSHEPGAGYLLRAVRPTSRGTGPAFKFNAYDETVWVPSSRYAREICNSKPHIVQVVGRMFRAKVPNSIRVIEIPEEYCGDNDR